MSTALIKAMEQSDAFVGTSKAAAYQLKEAGQLASMLSSPSMGGFFSEYKDQRRSRENYGAFEGWLYSAVNALAIESAAQPVNLARLKGSTITKKGRKPSGKKDYHVRRMTATARTKAASQEFEVLLEHPWLKTLEHPNEIQHRWQFVYCFVASLNLTGWSFIIHDQDKEGNKQLYAVPSTWVVPVHKDGPFSHFRVRDPKNLAASTSNEDLLTKEQVSFAYLPDPSNPLSAIAPATSQMSAIRIDNYIQTSQEQHFQNGIFPSVLVTVGKQPHPDVPGGIRPSLTPTQRRQVHTAINKVMAGVANYGSPAIIDGLIENITRFSSTEPEMGWSNSEDKVRTRILSAFGVHPYILGEPVNVGGYAQAAKIEERFCKRINTYLDMLSGLLTGIANQEEGSEDLLIWWEETKPHDPGLRWQGVQYARTNGDITQNELRAELGYPPDEDNNEAVISGSMTAQVVQLLAQVGAGAITSDQARAFLIAMGLSDDQAMVIAGNKTEQAAVVQATEEVKKAIEELKQPIDFSIGAIIDSLVLKYDPSQPRDPSSGRWGIGSGAQLAPDTGGGSGGGSSTLRVSGNGIEIYHSTAVEYAKSIMDKGLKATGKGCPKGVYASTQRGEAFSYGTHKAVEEFQKGVASGRYKPADSSQVKVLLIVADKSKFPETVYAGDKPTIFKSKEDVPPTAFNRVEVYNYKDAVDYRKKYDKYLDAGKNPPKMPPPKPVETIYKRSKAVTTKLFLCFGLVENKKVQQAISMAHV